MKLKMMSLIVMVGLLVSCGTTYNSTSNNAAYNVTVPSGIQANFAAQYPDATNIVWNSYDANNVPVDWTLTDRTALDKDDFVVTFNVGNNQYYGWYDANGRLVGSAYAITDYSMLPYSVNSMLQDKYKDYTIESAQREISGTQTAYEVKLKSGDNKVKLLVDSKGNVLKESK